MAIGCRWLPFVFYIYSAAVFAGEPGGYIGIGLGHTSINYKVSGQNEGVDWSFDSLSGNGSAASVYAGYETSILRYLYVAGEIEHSKNSADFVLTGVDLGGSNYFKIAHKQQLSASMLLGVSLGNHSGAILYAKGGFIRDEVEVSSSIDGLSQAVNKHGWKAGAGIKYNVCDSVDIRAEYILHMPDNFKSDFDVETTAYSAGIGLQYGF